MPYRDREPRNLLWSWMTGLAVGFIVVVTFYGINAQRTHEIEGGSATMTASPATPSGGPPSAPAPTAGQAPGAGGSETTGRSGADQAAPQAPAQNPAANEGTR